MIQPFPHRVVVALTSGRVSGVDVFSVTLVRALNTAGVSAHIVLTERDATEHDAMPLPDDVPREYLNLPRRCHENARLRAMLEYLHRQAPCIYLPNYDYRHSTVCAKLNDRVGVVGIVHSDDPLHYTHARRLGRYWNAIAAVSAQIYERLSLMDAGFRDRLVTIPYGITLPSDELRLPRKPGDPLRLLYVGRIEQGQKRVFSLVDILNHLTERGVACCLTVVGAGQAMAELRQRAARHIAAGRLKLTGMLPNREVGQEYRRHDIFVLTSAFEGLPVSLLEAMAHGCVPVVARTDSGIPDLIRDGDNGYVVDRNNASMFADRIAALHADPDRHLLAGRSARRTIVEQGFGVDRMVDDYCRLFQRVFANIDNGQFRRPRSKLPLGLLRRRLPARLRRVVALLFGHSA